MSSKSARFFRVVLTHNLESGTLELPRNFMNEQGKHLSKNVFLIVPTAAESKMKLRRSKDKAFLNKGWLEFAKKYSIQNRSILVFKYKGGYSFSVKIFDMSSGEIIYPVTSPNTTHKNAVYEEDSDDISYESKQEEQKINKGMKYVNQSRKLETGQGDLKTKEERVLERAKAFRSPNHHFMITITRTYASYYLYIKADHAEKLVFKLGKSSKNSMFLKLNGEDKRTWPMEYTKMNTGVRTCHKWIAFVRDNNIKAGDICVFEVVNKKEMVFNVTIFRIDNNDKEVVPIERTDFNPTTSKKKVKSAMKRVMNRAESFKSENPHFRICITSACIGSASVEIPRAHSRRYLKEDGNEENYIVLHVSSGRTWAVDYSYSLSNERSNSMEVFLTNGWIEFVKENHLKEGDCCIFEMMMGKSKAYKVTIYRVGDHA